MHDKNLVGFNAIPLADYEKHIPHTPLISNGPYRNAVPYDPGAGLVAGDILPRRVLRTASGNRGDVTVFSEWRDGAWTVIFERALNTGYAVGSNATDRNLTLAAGAVYTLGFGVFDDFVTTRRHFVTLPFTLGNEATSATVKARAN